MKDADVFLRPINVVLQYLRPERPLMDVPTIALNDVSIEVRKWLWLPIGALLWKCLSYCARGE